jgi:hypothetical protein
MIFQCLFYLIVFPFYFLYFHYILFSAGFSKSEGSTFHADPNYDPVQGKISFVLYMHVAVN